MLLVGDQPVEPAPYSLSGKGKHFSVSNRSYKRQRGDREKVTGMVLLRKSCDHEYC